MTIINHINTIQGVTTKDSNMFNLHELHIDGVHVGYVRMTNSKIEIIPHINFTVNAAKPIFVSYDEFHSVVDQYRAKGIISYNHSNTPVTVSKPSQTNINPLITTNLIGLTVTGETYGIVINEYSDSFGKDIVIDWEDGRTTQIDVNNITVIDDNTDILNPGIFIDLTGEYLSNIYI
jgi:hypothetical protein